MPITVRTQPQAYTPAYNPQWFTATSTMTAQPNFRYTVVLTDLITSETLTKNPAPDPNGILEFDNSSFARQYITQPNPSGLYGFQKNTGALRKMRVNIGETYDVAGVPTYFAGSNIDYLVWNGALDFLEMQSFTYQSYVYDQNRTNVRLITNNRNPLYALTPTPTMPYHSQPERTYTGRSNYIYCLSSNTTDMQFMTIVGYNATGTEVARTKIINTYNASTDYTNRYVFIDVGAKGLSNMPGAIVVSGTWPIPVSSYAYWDVFDSSNWLPNTGVPAGDYLWPLKRINNYCEARYDVNSIHYLSPEGAFDTGIFAKLSLRTTDATKTGYSKIPYSLSGYTMTYNYDAGVERVLTSSSRDKISVNTDWLEVYECSLLKDIIAAPIVLVDLGLSSGLVSMKVVTNSLKEEKAYNSSLRFLTFDLEFTHVNPKQNG